MADDRLREALDRLAKAAERFDPQDRASKERLEKLVDQVNRRLGGRANKEEDQRLADDLGEAVLHFEARHPLITETVREIKLALYGMGL
jgi:hypothetical protein